MSFIKNILIAVFMWALLGTSNALAHPHHGDHLHQGEHHHHQNHQNSAVSPFDSKKEVRSLHCLLKGHTDRAFCPHSNADGGQTPSIATDCGGKTSGAIPNSTSFGSEFAEIGFLLLIHHSPEKMLPLTITLPCHRFIDSLDPPPDYRLSLHL